MADKRWEELGKVLIHDSLKVTQGERVMIAMYETETYPLMLSCYAEVIKAGGYPQVQFMSEALKHQVLRYGNEEQISWIPEIESYGMEWADCYLALRGAFNMNECWDIPNEKIAKYQKAMGVISSMRWQKTRWALIRVPNERFAQQAHVSYDKIMDMFFNACLLVDWDEELKEYNRIKARLEQGSEIHLVGRGTDLTFRFDDNPWTPEIAADNIPGGEIFVTPKWRTVNGYISYEFPATIGGKVIHGLSYTFKDGYVTEIRCNNDLDYVTAILDSDEGSRRIGEFAFGMNKYIDTVTTDILIDEKFGGTIHTALGRPYDGSYYSAIHWDIIKDTRTEAKIYLDGELIFENVTFQS
ncbi:MAG: aminopeptidase [Oscillospiraceae bacterium]|nr:aminopeptidase [Oscillospiraceae bacterium]